MPVLGPPANPLFSVLCLTHCVFFSKHTVTGSVYESYSSLFPSWNSCFMKRWIGEEGRSFHFGKGIGKHSLGIKLKAKLHISDCVA